jgi:hypothetical protein
MRFGQASLNAVESPGSLFPFTDDEQTDPITGHRGALLGRLRARGRVPRIFATNTSAEYWRGDASLIHSDVEGRADVEPPAEVRAYLLAGTQHTPGALPPLDADDTGARGPDVQHRDLRAVAAFAAGEPRPLGERRDSAPPSAVPRLRRQRGAAGVDRACSADPRGADARPYLAGTPGLRAGLEGEENSVVAAAQGGAPYTFVSRRSTPTATRFAGYARRAGNARRRYRLEPAASHRVTS